MFKRAIAVLMEICFSFKALNNHNNTNSKQEKLEAGGGGLYPGGLDVGGREKGN